MLPAVLNLYFADPPVVLSVSGNVGAIPFQWLHCETVVKFPITTADEMEKEAFDAIMATPLFNGTSNRRLAAALRYFYVATRLFAAGNSPWEFMAEQVLNLGKALEVMFTSDRDKMRTGLELYGYSREEVESEFMPVVLLRSQFERRARADRDH